MTYLLIFFSLFFSTTHSETYTLTINVGNIKYMEGSLEVGIFNKNKGGKFLQEGEAFKSVSIEVKKGTETFEVKDLPKGDYAISLYHDKNSNGKCDRNFIGIPKEPYAFSNNFKPKFSPPTFKDCVFELSSDKSISIELIH